jgi:triosephosphate isomerase (TIM)
VRYVVLNWKMNPDSRRAASKLFKGTTSLVRGLKGVKVVVSPPPLFLPLLIASYRGTALTFGAQNVHPALRGAQTGETSVLMLKDAGVKYVILGHSERRALKEDNVFIQEKVAAVLAARMTPILCVGEKERTASGEYLLYIKEQLLSATSALEPRDVEKIIIAYEPLYAIGKSAAQALAPESVHEMSIFIRKVLTDAYGREVGMSVPILYGGSVEPENCGALMTQGEVQGFLLGHVSLDLDALSLVLKQVAGHVSRRG